MIILIALFCLGLNVVTRTPVQAGNLPKPTLWAEPGSVVPLGSPVTLWCSGNLEAQEFRLAKMGISPHWYSMLPLELGYKAKFSVTYTTESQAGNYYCYYLSSHSWSKNSDTLELVVTGLHSKPSLSALPSPVVASGGTVTLQCGSRQRYDKFILIQGNLRIPLTPKSQPTSGQHQALYYVGPVTSSRRWSFQCYGLFSDTPQVWSHPSDQLQLLVSGASGRPSLLSPQGLILTPGQTLTLQCHSEFSYDTFALYKEGDNNLPQSTRHHTQTRLSQANFSLDPVRGSHGGQYYCFGGHKFTYLWSKPSNPLDILEEGQLPYTPTLSGMTGPSVSPGDNVTLLCQSRGWIDTFLLAKEGTANPPLHIKVNKTEEITQAQFSFHPVTSAHNGTYRCYSSNSISPYRLSYPSAPLHLWVSGPSENSGAMSTADVHSLLIGLSTAGALLGLFLLLFLLLCLRHRRQAGHRKSGAAHPVPQDTGLHTCSRHSAHVQEDSPDTFTHTQSEERVRPNPQSRQDEDPNGATYAQVKHTGLRRGVASCTPLSGAWLNAQDRQTEEDTQTETPEAPLEVTYAQLKHLDTAQESTAPPPSQSGEPPEEPSVYAALAFH